MSIQGWCVAKKKLERKSIPPIPGETAEIRIFSFIPLNRKNPPQKGNNRGGKDEVYPELKVTQFANGRKEILKS